MVGSAALAVMGLRSKAVLRTPVEGEGNPTKLFLLAIHALTKSRPVVTGWSSPGHPAAPGIVARNLPMRILSRTRLTGR